MGIDRVVCTEDFRTLARRRLPRVLFDYIDGGSYGEVTLARNVTDLASVELPQRVMRDMRDVDLSVELFGSALAMPVVLGPVGFAGMYARRGEVQAARAAKAAGVPFTLSTVGICSVEEVTKGSGAPPWFQLYMIKDRGFIANLLARVWAAGARVLVTTVDLPTPGARYRDLRSGMGRQLGLAGRLSQAFDGLRHPSWLSDVYLRGRPHSFGNLSGALPPAADFADAWGWIKANFDRSVTWADLDFVRAHWPGRVVIKGILHVDDARAAADAGADGVVVSNHGGRQLDGVRSSISILPDISDAVGDRTIVLMDGGVRSGLDVLKALSLGARACLLGRAWAWALAAGGETGVTRLLAILREELTSAIILSGGLPLSNKDGKREHADA